MFAAVVFPMAASGISDTWFSYVDQRAILSALLRSEATSAADKIESFLDGINVPLGSTLPPQSSNTSVKQLRLLALRAMHQVPGILSISLVDDTGAERLHISRTGSSRTEGGADRSGDPAVVGAKTEKVWYGPVIYRQGFEPSMTVAMATYDDAVVVKTVIAEISLKPVWLIVSEIRVGRSGLDICRRPDWPTHRSSHDQQSDAGRRRESSFGPARIAGCDRCRGRHCDCKPQRRE